MFFYVLLGIPIIMILVWVSVWTYDAIKNKRDAEHLGMLTAVSIMLSLIPAVFLAILFHIWGNYADLVSKIENQNYVIEVQEEKISELSNTLEVFKYPDDPSTVKLNADAPIKSVVESMTEAHNKLADAKEERAMAIREVEAIRRGPMSGVISFVGDYNLPENEKDND